MDNPRTTASTGTTVPPPVTDDATAWAGTAWRSGVVSAMAFVLATALVVAQALEVFGAAPGYAETDRGQLADEADFFAAARPQRRSRLGRGGHRRGLRGRVPGADTPAGGGGLAQS